MWWKIFPWTFNLQFRGRSQIFFGNLPTFFAQNLKKTKTLLFWTTLFSSKNSFGLINQNFCIAADFVCWKSNLFFALNAKIIEKTLLSSKDIFPPKGSSALEGSSFAKLSEKPLLKVGNWQNGSSKIRKCDKIYSLGYVIFSLENAARSFLGQHPSVFRSMSEKDMKNVFFSFHDFSPQSVLLG